MLNYAQNYAIRYMLQVLVSKILHSALFQLWHWDLGKLSYAYIYLFRLVCLSVHNLAL